MKIRVCVDQPDPKLAKSKFLGKVLCVPVENLNEKIKFDELEENAFYNVFLKEAENSHTASFRCELIAKKKKK
ncbi:hypothetical protein BpHYR1_027900 [Brachionus plicatilis]|uniref:Uncharacterized protein n=1 Tax=Brachionus plicatilis TaxID=10195 RepID=A0A3M7QZQ5_BRAPC|nr:hypothetical protein BpHYR1_027900 [Brachionus plicatilis]